MANNAIQIEIMAVVYKVTPVQYMMLTFTEEMQVYSYEMLIELSRYFIAKSQDCNETMKNMYCAVI